MEALRSFLLIHGMHVALGTKLTQSDGGEAGLLQRQLCQHTRTQKRINQSLYQRLYAYITLGLGKLTKIIALHML